MTYPATITMLVLALLALSGCATQSGAYNTSYAQYQGPSPDAEITGMRSGTINAQY
ncbi:hypothetical protein J2Y48_003907 [Mycoplana sp. BE70]|uniref:hypothetical protein n=1 Tax=Mycoplana sp. BE70 TaxID=2817775 RepID=UPI00285FF6A3|nr:hypothetical protein [Mycoplana sp. BE70]MDR6758607.1 hypothetical protein [Mycoplana sp. BE70]